MTDTAVTTHTLDNGMTLLIEPMPSVKSAAFAIFVPSGSIFDPPGRSGTSNILAEMFYRGAGAYSSRELNSALDDLGVNSNSRTGSTHIIFAGATVAVNLPEALSIFGAIIREPHLSEDEFEPSRESVALSLRSIEDEPQQKVFQELKRRTYDHPWGDPADGRLEDLPQITLEDVHRLYHTCVRPNDCILSVAGNVDPQQIIELVESLFGDWELKTAPDVTNTPSGPAIDHLHFESEQTQIGIAWPSVAFRHPDYYTAWATVSILSGGMSSRLFSEVREKRGLCYSVYATHHSLRTEARVLAYAGTTSERAQETLDVTLSELKRLQEGITEEELKRCQVRARSSLVMQQESTMRRASSLANSWYHLGRVITVDEINNKILSLTTDSIRAFTHEHPARNFTIMTIGPQPLEVPDEV